MRLHKLITRSAALIAAIATIACSSEQPKEEGDTIPTTPINEMAYTPEATTFELWAPTAEAVVVRLYNGDTLAEEVAMTAAKDGLWRAQVEGDKHGMYYAFQVTIDGKPLKETAGIFARALDVNGNRGAVIDLERTNPEGWESDGKGSA